ncbi:hypothetical protein [Actinomadura harenae]|uniref:Uncharacterized protein n=1 Tax=Actinomadura harenae TaxID=2483351 RepID=A0A3M2M566_9ACTN|nr:hypothetical protein [Actinomadura harenae]RMI44716.1 hypothetical protein EBO15_12245 [Actinomadura harenae]
MGIRNVKAVFDNWRQLPDGPFRLLVYMAIRSMDDDDPPVYFAGRDELVMAIGRELPDMSETDAASDRARAASYEAVKRAVRTLKADAAITVIRRGGAGRNATYALHLKGNAQPSPKGAAQPSPKGNTARSAGGRAAFPQGVQDNRGSTSGRADGASVGPSVDLPDLVVSLLRASTGQTVSREHATKVVQQIGPGTSNTPRYVETCIRRDPAKYLPTPTPPRFTASGGFESR